MSIPVAPCTPEIVLVHPSRQNILEVKNGTSTVEYIALLRGHKNLARKTNFNDIADSFIGR